MSQQQAPWLETAYGWAYGENGWNSGMDSNLLKFSVMFDRNVDSIVASLPAAVNGQVHYNTSDNRIYFAVGTTYFSTVVPKWFTFVVRSTGATWQFNGTALVAVEGVGSLDTRIDAIELTLSTLGSAAFEDVSAFATQAALDVLGGQTQAYTDALRSDLADTGGAELIGHGAETVADALNNIASVVVAGTGSDQSAELIAALASGKSVILRGAITLASPVTSTAASNFIFSESAAITYTGTAGATHVLKFSPSSVLVIRGKLSIDCGNKAGIGLSCRALAAAKYIEVAGVTVIDCLQASPSTMGAHGIQIVNDSTGFPDFISVTGCVVNGVSRSTADAPGSACSGITACDGLTTLITGNTISGVSIGNGTINADGLVVFSDLVGSVYQRSNALLSSNTISDCSGRLIKLQTRGKAVVRDNLLKISNIALVTPWRGIDSQVGDADIINNKIEFTGAWSGGLDLAVIQMQLPSTAEFTGQSSNHLICDNVINVGASATRINDGRCFMSLLDNLATAAVTASVDIRDNFVTYEGGIGATTKACNIAFSVYCPNTFVSGATASVKLRDNQVSATNFLESLGGAASSDLTGKLGLLQISGNTLLSPDSIPVLTWSAGNRFTSDLLIYGNAVGLRGGEVVAPFDFSRIKPGCEFVIGAGGSGYSNNPGSYTFSEVRHSGAFIQVDRGDTLVKSGFAPVPGAAITWTTYTL